MAKKLLTECSPFKFQLVENKNGDGFLYARGEFGKADIATENKRVYPRPLWQREINKIQEDIKAGKVLGELDHPADGKTSLKRVSHIITNIWMEDDGRVMGELKLCNNKWGNQAKSILEAGGQIGISSRGMGSTRTLDDGLEEVQEDFQYMTHDLVADPAVRTSYPTFSNEEKEVKKPVAEQDSKDDDGAVVVVAETKKEETMDKKKEEDKDVKKAPVSENQQETAVETNGKPDSVVAVAPAKEPGQQDDSNLEDKFAKELVQKLEQQKESVTQAVRDELMSDPEVAGAKTALESIKNVLRPFILQDDVETELRARDAKIKELEDLLSGKTEEVNVVSKNARRIAETARHLGFALYMEKTLSESPDAGEIKKLVGDVRKYGSRDELQVAMEGAKTAIAKKIAEARAKDLESKKLTEGLEKQLAEMKARQEKTEKALSEAVALAQDYGIKFYVESKLRENPGLAKNASRIRNLCEGKTDKAEVDKVVANFNVATNSGRDYNSIRERFEKAKRSKLVENHLKETGGVKPETSRGVVEEGVDAEMVELGVARSQVGHLL